MKRKLIVTSIFFVSGLLTMAMITLSLLMSLINKPVALSVDRIAGAVSKSLDVLSKRGELSPVTETKIITGTSGVSTLTLSAAIIGKARLKGIPVRTTPAIVSDSREFKPVLSVTRKVETNTTHSKSAVRSFRANNAEELAYKLLSLNYAKSADKLKRGIAIKLLSLQLPDGGWSVLPGMSSDPYTTGQALFALQESGMLSPESPDSQHAIAYLLKSQHEDGSWLLPSGVVADYAEKTMTSSDENLRESATNHWASLALLESLPDKD